MTKFLTALMVLLLTIGTASESLTQTQYRAGYATYYSGNGLSAQGLQELPTGLFTNLTYFYSVYTDFPNLTAPGGDEAQWQRLKTWAHSNGVNVSICGAGGSDWLSAISTPAGVSNTANIVCNYIYSKGFDGFDLDWEVDFSNTDTTHIASFVHALRDSMTARGGGHKYITAYTTIGKTKEIEMWTRIAPYMDFVNMQAYDIVGSWTGYTSHYSPLYSPNPFHTDGNNIDAGLKLWISMGYPRSKLLVGGTSDAEMYIGGTMANGNGPTLPGQTWTSQPAIYADVKARDNLQRWEGHTWLWDSVAQSTYISVDRAGTSQDSLVCFNDGRALSVKWIYAINNSLGGIFVWEAANTFEDWKPVGQERWSILRTLANTIHDTTIPPPPPPPPSGSITASPLSLPTGGGNVTLTWASQNATSASISGIGVVPVSGTRVVNITNTTTFTLALTGNNQTVTYSTSVIVGPVPITMGETNILGASDNGNGNLLCSQSATLSQPATVQSISFYILTASGNLRLGIYSNTNNKPGTLLATTNQFTPIAGWNTQNVVTPVTLSAGTYWLAFLPSSSSLAFAIDRSSGTICYVSRTFGALPATFPSGSATGTAHWSLYATLTSGQAVAPTGTFTANPTSLPYTGGNVTLTWTSQNATSASISGIGSVPLNGSQVVSVTTTTTWNLTLVGSSNIVYSVTTVVAPPPVSKNDTVTVSFQAFTILVPKDSTNTVANLPVQFRIQKSPVLPNGIDTVALTFQPIKIGVIRSSKDTTITTILPFIIKK